MWESKQLEKCPKKWGSSLIAEAINNAVILDGNLAALNETGCV